MTRPMFTRPFTRPTFSPPDMSSPPDGGGDAFTDEEFRELARLLARYATCRLDQYELWKLELGSGTVYVDIARRPYQGASAVAYRCIWPPAPERPEPAV